MTHHNSRPPLIAYTCLLIAVVLWASSFIALKVAFASYGTMFVIFARMLVASLCFVVLWRYVGAINYQKGDWKPFLLMTLCEPCLYFIFEALALQHTSASQAGMITATLPLMVAIGAWVVLKEQLSQRLLIGFAISMAGVIWLTLGGEASEQAPNPLFGNSMEFLAMVCAAGYTISLKYLSSRYSALFLTAVQSFAGALFFLPLLFTQPLPTHIASDALWAILYLGAGITLGAYFLFNQSLSWIPVGKAVGFTNLIPVFTIILAALILGEEMTLAQYSAAAVVFLGLLISQYQPRKRPQPLAEPSPTD